MINLNQLGSPLVPRLKVEGGSVDLVTIRNKGQAVLITCAGASLKNEKCVGCGNNGECIQVVEGISGHEKPNGKALIPVSFLKSLSAPLDCVGVSADAVNKMERSFFMSEE